MPEENELMEAKKTDDATYDFNLNVDGKVEEIRDGNGNATKHFKYLGFRCRFAPDGTVDFTQPKVIVTSDDRVSISIHINSHSDPEGNSPHNHLRFQFAGSPDINLERPIEFHWECDTNWVKVYPNEGPIHIPGAFRTTGHPTWRFVW
jgi:hypothetical protein